MNNRWLPNFGGWARAMIGGQTLARLVWGGTQSEKRVSTLKKPGYKHGDASFSL